MNEMASLSMHKPADDSDSGDVHNSVAAGRRRKIRLALILGAIAVSLYVLSIVSIVFSRGGAV